METGMESSIIEKIKKIEALIAGATTDGEKQAAISAKHRILDKYPEIEVQQNQREYRLLTQGEWHKKLLLALCAKYGVKAYRYPRQKHTTVTVKINPEFLNKVLWKEYLDYSAHLALLIDEITTDLINKIHEPGKEEEVAGLS
jgi:hypothetical protein